MRKTLTRLLTGLTFLGIVTALVALIGAFAFAVSYLAQHGNLLEKQLVAAAISVVLLGVVAYIIGLWMDESEFR